MTIYPRSPPLSPRNHGFSCAPPAPRLRPPRSAHNCRASWRSRLSARRAALRNFSRRAGASHLPRRAARPSLHRWVVLSRTGPIAPLHSLPPSPLLHAMAARLSFLRRACRGARPSRRSAFHARGAALPVHTAPSSVSTRSRSACGAPVLAAPLLLYPPRPLPLRSPVPSLLGRRLSSYFSCWPPAFFALSCWRRSPMSCFSTAVLCVPASRTSLTPSLPACSPVWGIGCVSGYGSLSSRSPFVAVAFPICLNEWEPLPISTLSALFTSPLVFCLSFFLQEQFLH